ncbi:MAG: reverse transcriptase family protein [Nakamurella sp.]
MRADLRLAAALADAMLAGPWEFEQMVDRGRLTVGGRPRWLRQFVREVLAGYPHPPSDRPRELAAFVQASRVLDMVRRSDRTPPRPTVRLSSPTATTRRPFHTPVIDHIGVLAEHLGQSSDELVELADTRLRARRAHSERIANYRYRWLERPAGPRLLEVPKPRLATVQRRILDELLAPIPVHPAAHGFVTGRSAITGAAAHVGARLVITLDLEHFFAAVGAGRIWGVLRSAGYPEPVAHLLTGLTTHASPVSALTAMPTGPDPSRDFRLRRRLAAPHLPQGAASSPRLANLVAFSLDRRLDAYARAAGVRYTRYADDLTFSGGQALVRRAAALTVAVEKIVGQEGFRVNPAKTRRRRADQRQLVTGIVVNDRVNVARPDFDRLRAVLHDCRVSGPVVANRQGHPAFREHLLGRISWVTALNPGRGNRLRAAFDAIDWSPGGSAG